MGAKGHNDQAAAMVELSLSARPDYAEALAVRAQLRLRAGALVEALADTEAALSYKPHLTQLWPLVAMLRYQSKDLTGAIEALENVLEIEPDNGGYLVNLGEFKRQAGDIGGAIKMLEKAVTVDSDNAGAWTNYGIVLQTAGRKKEAGAAYERALKINPRQAETINNLGAMAKDDDNWELALKYFQKAVDIQPELAEAHDNLGSAFKELGRLDEAAISFQQAIAIKPDDAEAHSNLGYVFHEQRKLDEAVSSYHKALAFRPDSAEVHNNLGNALRDLGELDEAVASYHRAVSIKPDFAQAHYNIGFIFLDCGRLDEAIASQQRALALKQDYPEAGTHLTILYFLQGSLIKSRQQLMQISDDQINRLEKAQSRQFCGSFKQFLQLAVENRNENKQDFTALPEAHTLRVVGESHAIGVNNLVLRLSDGRSRQLASLPILGCKAWHLAEQKRNKYKTVFERLLRDLRDGEDCVFIIGEIDCRCDEGIIVRHLATGDSLAGIVETTVAGYLGFLENAVSSRNIRPIISGVPAPRRLGPGHGDRELQLNYQVDVIRLFNSVLQAECKKRNFRVLDIYGSTAEPDGFADGRNHLDHLHLNPSVYRNLLQHTLNETLTGIDGS